MLHQDFSNDLYQGKAAIIKEIISTFDDYQSQRAHHLFFF
jgi:hypothetical protein